jgi:SAM-dependent methyltransferase
METMALAFSSEERSPLVHALLADLRLAPGAVDLSIDARDEMLGFLLQASEGDRDRALFQYFRSGASIAASLGQALRWRFGDPPRIDRLLDFASGYGRVTRFLVREVPAERVWVSDVYEGGVRFQEERLGVRGIVSAVRPEDFRCAERFDAILVTSLFTHLPAERFVAWLRVLLGLLTPRGLLAFSTHSPAVLPHGVEMPASGIVFEERSESDSLDTSDYGSTWVTEAFVREALARAAGTASLHRLDRGLCNFQDLYLAVPEPDADFSGFRFNHEPYLFVERCALADEGRRVTIDGWAASLSGAPREVQAVLDGEVVATAPVVGPREDVAASLGSERFLRSGWDCSFPLPAGASRSSVLLLRVVDERGEAHPLQASTLDGALLGAARLEVKRLESEWARAEAQAVREIAALRDRIKAMEASRFWKMRNAWFRLKRRLGLTDET